jgi:hypothetical protein
MTHRTRIGAVATAAGLLLAGCAGTGIDSVGTTTQRSYDPTMLSEIAKRGGMPLEVKGDPFPGESDRFAALAARKFTENHFGPDFAVYPQGTREPDPDAPNNPWRTVLVVNAKDPVAPSAVCRAGEVKGTPASDGKLDMTAALCLGDKAVTSLKGWGSDIEGPESPRLGRLFEQIAPNLYPLRDDDQDGPDADFDI